MYGITIVGVMDTLLMNVQPQNDSKLDLYFVGDHLVQEFWNLKQHKTINHNAIN